ncbi:hypothetical protein VTJ04DRAFT_6198 [Mycothermus thermophilus]|uniref:uncharacterized protein n=1 Tax=Humicola insolens TaxID=85995 RepID=UPI0037443CA0
MDVISHHHHHHHHRHHYRPTTHSDYHLDPLLLSSTKPFGGSTSPGCFRSWNVSGNRKADRIIIPPPPAETGRSRVVPADKMPETKQNGRFSMREIRETPR